MLRPISIASVLVLLLASIGCNDGGRRGRIGSAGGSGGDAGMGGRGGSPPPPPPPPTCVMTGPTPQCQMSCSNGHVTTLTGKVYAPNGTLPLYNAIVYVPSQATAPFTTGATCAPCDGKVSGNPIVTALTGPDGSFTLANVPVGAQIPLVVQLGKWRRQVTLSVPACTTTAVSAADTRLPRNKSEGDMPQMAIATGWADPFECLLLKTGIDEAEFTAPGGGGRVSFYVGDYNGGTTLASGTTPAVGTMMSSPQSVQANDIIILPCEGGPTVKADTKNLVDYLDMGGRVFATHYSYDWLAYPGIEGKLPMTPGSGSPFNVVGQWDLDQPGPSSWPYVGTIDTSFPKGMAFQQWMQNVGAAVPISISEPRNDLDSVNPMYGQRWIYNTTDTKIQHMTFNTPIDPPIGPDMQPQYCGRAVFSDFHVSADALMGGGPWKFPTACKDPVSGNVPAMTDEEKVLTFMLFDLSSCVQPDSAPPVPPIT